MRDGCAGVGVAEGKECKGISFPEQAQVEGSNLTLNGLDLRQATMFKVIGYVAALYVARPPVPGSRWVRASTTS